MWGVKYQVSKCGSVELVKFKVSEVYSRKVWSVECKVWSVWVVTTSRSPDNAIRRKTRNTTRLKCCSLPRKVTIGDRQSAALATKNATHLRKTWHKYCACHTKPRLTRLETLWHVTKCHACRAKRHYNLFWNLQQGKRFCSFPHRHCDGSTEASDSRRDMLEDQKEHFARQISLTSQRKNQRFPTGFLMDPPQNRHFVRRFRRFFHHVLQNATAATESATCHHFAQRWQCDSQKTRNTTRLKCRSLPRKVTIRDPQSAALATKNAAHRSQNGAKVLRLPHKTSFDTSWKMLKYYKECHACHAKWSYVTLESSKSDPFCRTYHTHGLATSRGHVRTVADGCGRLRTVANGWATSGEHSCNPQTPRVKREHLLRIRENELIWMDYVSRMFCEFLWFHIWICRIDREYEGEKHQK